MNERPCSAAEAVERALSLVGTGGAYFLGTGDYRPCADIDVPWTARESDGAIGCDCAGFIVWAYKLRRHRPGYNAGGRYDVEDDLNCNSMLGDGFGARELFTIVTGDPLPGDVVAYPSFHLYEADGSRVQHDGRALHWIGHTGIVIGTTRVSDWDPVTPRYEQLDIAQCKGPDGRTPAVIVTDGFLWARHDRVWPKPEHRSWLIRAVP